MVLFIDVTCYKLVTNLSQKSAKSRAVLSAMEIGFFSSDFYTAREASVAGAVSESLTGQNQ